MQFKINPVKTPIRRPFVTSLRRPLNISSGCVLAVLPEVRNKWFDYSGYNNHGTIFGATKVSGRNAEGLSFDGVDDYVNCGSAASLDNIPVKTIELWTRLDSQTGSRSEEHTSELQSHSFISYAVFCLKKKIHYNFILS